MKYIITESRLNQAIYEYLDEMFPEDQMNLEHPLEYDEDEDEDFEDKCRIKFSIGDDDNAVFYYYEKCYWSDVDENTMNRLRLFEKYNPPYLDIEEPFGNILRGMFGNHLDEPFKEWFTNRYKLPLNKIG